MKVLFINSGKPKIGVGRFIPGHKVLPSRDKTSGKFTPVDINTLVDRIIEYKSGVNDV